MEYHSALSKAETYCATSEKSPQEVIDKLSKWGVSRGNITKIIAKLTNDDFINEERYSLAFVKDKFKFNRWGKTKIAFMLHQKGIDSKQIEKSLQCIDEEEYLATAVELLTSKCKSIKDKEHYAISSKLFRFALSRGFESSIIQKAIRLIDLAK